MEYEKARRDLVAAVVLLAFSVIYFTQTFKIRQTSLISISSASIPRICALLLAIVSLVLLAQSGLHLLQHKKLSKQRESTIGEEEKRTEQKKLYTVIWLFVILFFGILLTEKLGFTYGMFVYLLGTLILMNRNIKRKWIFLVIAVIVPAWVYVLFTRAFYLRLPRGFLDIGGGVL